MAVLMFAGSLGVAPWTSAAPVTEATTEIPPCCDHGDSGHEASAQGQEDGDPEDEEPGCGLGCTACPCCISLHMLAPPALAAEAVLLAACTMESRSQSVPKDPEPKKIIHVPRRA